MGHRAWSMGKYSRQPFDFAQDRRTAGREQRSEVGSPRSEDTMQKAAGSRQLAASRSVELYFNPQFEVRNLISHISHLISQIRNLKSVFPCHLALAAVI